MSEKRLNSLKGGNVVFENGIQKKNLFLWLREINHRDEDEHNGLVNYAAKRNNIEIASPGEKNVELMRREKLP